MLQVLPNPQAFFEAVLAHINTNQIVVTVFPLREDIERDIISTKRPGGVSGHPYWVFGRNWLELFVAHGSIEKFVMPCYRFTLNNRPYPQWAVIIKKSF
jgi:hypothetical protein